MPSTPALLPPLMSSSPKEGSVMLLFCLLVLVLALVHWWMHATDFGA